MLIMKRRIHGFKKKLQQKFSRNFRNVFMILNYIFYLFSFNREIILLNYTEMTIPAFRMKHFVYEHTDFYILKSQGVKALVTKAK